MAAATAEPKEAVMDSTSHDDRFTDTGAAIPADAGDDSRRTSRTADGERGRDDERKAGATRAAARGELPYKVPLAAGFLSLMPGLGQIYVGYYAQGFINIAIVAGIITMLAGGMVGGLEPFFGLSLAFFWVFNVIDAIRRAQAYNRMLDGLRADELPEQVALPGSGSPRAWGIVLVVFGGLLFLNTKFDVSLDWLEEWWPLIPVVFGIYLIRKGRRDRDA
jgi:hypothetical protein